MEIKSTSVQLQLKKHTCKKNKKSDRKNQKRRELKSKTSPRRKEVELYDRMDKHKEGEAIKYI